MTTAEHYSGTPATTTGGADRAHFTAALIQATLGARRIPCMVALAWDGPQLWAYSCSLGLGEDPGRVAALSDALALAVGASSARVARDGGRLIIEIPKPDGERRPLNVRKLEALTPPTSTSVALGLATGGRAAWLDIADSRTPHLLLAGTTGSGKTTLLHWLLFRLFVQNDDPAELRAVMLDPKNGELRPFVNAAALLHPIASSPAEMARLLSWATSELDRRLATGRTRPRIVIVAEELADIQKVNPDAAGAFARIAQVGRSAGLTLIGTTQQPGAKALGDSLANFPCRLLGRVASATLTFGAAGRGRTQAHELLGNGDFLLLHTGGATRFQAPLCQPGHIAQRLPRAETPATLADEMPVLASFADVIGRDKRGGQGRRAVDYASIETDLAGGASAEDLKRAHHIGSERASRIWRNYHETGSEDDE